MRPRSTSLRFWTKVELLLVHAVGVVDEAVGVGEGDDLAAELQGFLGGVQGDVARARHADGEAVEALVGGFEHVLAEVDAAVAGGFGAAGAAAVGQAFSSQRADEAVLHALVLAEEVADLAGAHADVAGGHVGVFADVAGQLGHEALAEAHDFAVALVAGVEVGAALGPAHGQAGEAVFEGLLKAQELQHALRDGGVETQAALVGADGVVELHPPGPVGPDLAVVVFPGHPEDHDAVRLGHALEDLRVAVFGVLGDVGDDAGGHLTDRLVKLLFVGVPLLQAFHEGVDVA